MTKKSLFGPVALAALLGATLLVSSCTAESTDGPSVTSSGSSISASPEVPTTSDRGTLTSLDQISVSATPLGTAPTITADWPLVADKTMTKTLIQGDGPVITDKLQFAFYDLVFSALEGPGTTSFIMTEPFVMDAVGNNLPPAENELLVGLRAGSRVLMAITATDFYAPYNEAPPAEYDYTRIVIVDIIYASDTQPTGTSVADGDQYATVTTDNGVPVIHPIAGAPVPDTTVVTTLIEGSSNYTAGQYDTGGGAWIRYLGVVAQSGRVLESNYGDQDPMWLYVGPMDPSFTGNVFDTTVLSDLRVGSRALITIPAADAYPLADQSKGPDGYDPPLEPGQTVVYVIDVLWSQPAQRK
jgi:peptidylprolyl isomerase